MSSPILPTAEAVLDALQNASAPTRANNSNLASIEVMDPIRALHRNNVEQWDREDDARKHHDDDALVAGAKREIDRLNRARHGFIEAIDQAVLALLGPQESAPFVTETPGMAIDRLSVLVIRLTVTEARAASGLGDARLYAERLPQLRGQLNTLVEAITTLLSDLESGLRRFLAYQSLKLYGPPGSQQAP